jgi:hypothetical protein
MKSGGGAVRTSFARPVARCMTRHSSYNDLCWEWPDATRSRKPV